jgi:spermidine/putrescine transport system substrate-binding protein
MKLTLSAHSLNKLIAVTLLVFISTLSLPSMADQKIVNVYAWTGEVSDNLVKQFEKDTGIKVNFSTYQSNEIMYAKIRAGSSSSYDVIMPSSYFVDRMRKQNMLAELDMKKLPNWKNLNPDFLHPIYDPESKFSAPFIWGVTGIFVNSHFENPDQIHTWEDLWNKRYANQLLLLDDTREVFSMALISLGYSPNDNDALHLKQAFEKLQLLMKNVKVFSSETVISILVDEDAKLGMSWNGDAYKASRENKDIHFIYPQDGFVIWVDNFAIPKDAPHKDEAHAFINFMLSAEAGKTTAMLMNYPIANLAGQKLLPAEIRDNPIIYPSAEVLKRGKFQRDPAESTLESYEKYWEALKMAG